MEEKRIILVEDDPDHADLIKEVLEGEFDERDIVLIRDGRDAIDYFQEFSIKWDGQIKDKINLILLDLNLPKASVMDVLKFLKKDKRYHPVPVIILSTNSDKKTIDEAYRNGVNGYVTKPVSYEEFVAKLEGLKEYY
ncbi:MAG: Response regulator rcp1 [Candidatus Scalindua arabica]|uniref:Response regulator rcp1 n=1 Tax=Candidatus Scalindua arabica TaxID=1127984 RepID=A0A941W0E7_9BACT|nr:Response regulator rcp1 [Candidatus Scalindua arabica]